MAWPIGPCYAQDGYVVATGSPDGWYNPFRFYCRAGSSRELEKYHSLYVRLARLADASDDKLAAFCSRYGLPSWPEARYRRFQDWSGYFESGTEVAYPISHLRAIARLMVGAGAVFEAMKTADLPAHEAEIRDLATAVAEVEQVGEWLWGYVDDLYLGRIKERSWRADRGGGDPTVTEEEPDSCAEEDYDNTETILAYWSGRPTDALYHLAVRWGVTWDGGDVGRLTSTYWYEDYCGGHEPRPKWLNRIHEPQRELLTLADRTKLVTAHLASLGDPRAESYPSLTSALIAMLVRDQIRGGRFRICEYCGRLFCATHALQRFCPPDRDPMSGNPYGCAKRRADRKYGRRRRGSRPKASGQ